jgi:hypothetical protein
VASALVPQTTHTLAVQEYHNGYTGPVASASATTLAAPSGATPLQWQPGTYMVSKNTNAWSTSVTGASGGGGNGRNLTEYPIIAASIKAHPTLFKGYSPQYYWPSVDGPAINQYNFAGVKSDFDGFEAACVSAGCAAYYFVPQIAAYVVEGSGTPFSANGGTAVVPSYIFNGGGATYGNPPGGASGAGWLYGQLNANGNYAYLHAALYNSNTNARWIKMWQALYATPWVSQTGIYAGKNYTFGTHPFVGGMIDWTDSDLNALYGAPVLPSDYSGEGFNQQRKLMLETMAGTMPNTPFGMMVGYGPTGAPSSDQLTLVQAAQQYKCGLSASDVFFTPGGGTPLTYAQHYIQGQLDTGTGGNHNWVSGGTPYSGIYMPVAQGGDYTQKGGSGNQAQVLGMMNQAYNVLGAQYFFLCASDTTYADSVWNAYIAPAVVAFGALPSKNAAYPYA